jgi:AcrR family transcriptional regulator
VLEAAAAVFGEMGYEGGSIAAISERSGVSKPSIHLRWPSRRELFLAALAEVRPPVAPPPSADLRGDLVAWGDAAAEAVAGGQRPLVRAALFAAAREPEIAAALDARLIAPLRAELIAILDRRDAGGAGERDPGTVAELLLAPVVQAAVTGRPAAVRTAAEVVARALERVGATV